MKGIFVGYKGCIGYNPSDEEGYLFQILHVWETTYLNILNEIINIYPKNWKVIPKRRQWKRDKNTKKLKLKIQKYETSIVPNNLNNITPLSHL